MKEFQDGLKLLVKVYRCVVGDGTVQRDYRTARDRWNYGFVYFGSGVEYRQTRGFVCIMIL